MNPDDCGCELPASEDGSAPRWMKSVLVAAAAYNLIWGMAAILHPNLLFDLLEMPRPNYPGLWQCIGMIVGVYGVGYAIAAFESVRHWPIVLVGLLGKVFGPIGFAHAAATGSMPWRFGAVILTNDIVWWWPFVAILRHAAAEHRRTMDRHWLESAAPAEVAMAHAVDQFGRSLIELSRGSPVLVVFLRHLGCTFCREAIADVARVRNELARHAIVPAFVFPSQDNSGAREFFKRHDLADAPRFGDPDQQLYRAFGLLRGSVSQLFGWKSWKRAFVEGAMYRHGLGVPTGDGLQMPGVFLVREGMIECAFRHRSAADRPDYLAIALCNRTNRQIPSVLAADR